MNIDTQSHDVFLATTALEEFWDTTKPIVFLGQWCLLYGRRSFWAPLNGKVLDSPFDNGKSVQTAYHYVEELYEHVLSLLAGTLNEIHRENHGNRYWRILLGPWLLLYLPVIYDRYSHVKRALENYPSCHTLGLSEESFVVPSNTEEFSGLIKEDAFNLQIYTKIFLVLGRIFPAKARKNVSQPLYNKSIGRDFKNRSVNGVSKFFARFTAKIFSSILIKNSYFPKSAELRFSIRNIGRVLPIWGQSNKLAEPKYNSDMRKKLQIVCFGDGQFERCLSAMLSSDIPTCFIEGYQPLVGAAQKEYPTKIKGIFSANGWYYDEIFKCWAANSAEAGAILLGTQHGGNYGALANMPSENHETAIVDEYYSWGWGRTGCAAKIVPMPASKLLGREKIADNSLKEGILWVATSSPRYLTQFPFLVANFSEYLHWQSRFINTLHQQILARARLRPHREDNDWGLTQRILDCVPDIRIETWDTPFQHSLINCRLYVCDHLSTTFAEALAANKPTILFWNPLANELRPEAQPYYDLLRKNGILFDTPESAATAVNQIYADVETWWNDPERQSAVDIFCDRFARTSSDADKLWTSEFNRIAALPSSLGH